MKICSITRAEWVNTLRPRQDGRHSADNIFICIFFNEYCCILIEFPLKYVRKGPIDNNPALVQIMAWRRSGDKPLSEPMVISLPTHICVTQPQWVNSDYPATGLQVFAVVLLHHKMDCHANYYHGYLGRCSIMISQFTIRILLMTSPDKYVNKYGHPQHDRCSGV